jgi:hypothetical protein
MALRTSEHLADAMASLRSTAKALKTYAQGVKAASEAGPISGNVVVELYLRLVADKARPTTSLPNSPP